jgi:hypothetical protein
MSFLDSDFSSPIGVLGFGLGFLGIGFLVATIFIW